MKVNPEKPKKSTYSRRGPSEAANLKRFCKDHSDVLCYLEAFLLDAYEHLTHYRHADYSRDVATLRRRYESEGLSFATRTLPSLFENFLSFLETGIPSYPSFKLVRGGKHPVFLRQLFAMVCECHDNDDTTDDIDTMKHLYQLCCAFKKLKGPYRRRTLQKQLWSFVETDISLRYIDFFADPVYPVLVRAREYVKQIIGDLSPEFDTHLFIPRPGPGATNTPRQKNVRYRPHVLYEQLDEVMPYVDFYYSHPWDLVTEPIAYQGLERKCAPSSRFKFVPKTYSKPRGICIEEQETQYLQQALKHCLYDHLEHHPITKGYVNFRDQSINGRLALESSDSRGNATIDMSEASDRISRTLVRLLFHDCPDMRDALLATSTRTIQLPTDGDAIDFPSELPCEKFAPMGSATCFPVMSLIHFVLIKAIIDETAPTSERFPVYVYGDDIILPSKYVNLIYEWLPLFGMKLNEEKSYFRSRFRESCGLHAYRGVEITPEYVKYIPKVSSTSNEVVSLLSTESRLFYKGMRRAAELFRVNLHKVQCTDISTLPYVGPKSPILGWIREYGDAPLNPESGLPRRFRLTSKDSAPGREISWSCRERNGEYVYLVRVVVPQGDDLSIDAENERYLRWLLENPNCSGREDYPLTRQSGLDCCVQQNPGRPSGRTDHVSKARRRVLARQHAIQCMISEGTGLLKDSSLDSLRIVKKFLPKSAFMQERR